MMFPKLELDTGRLSAECCVKIANALSKEVSDFDMMEAKGPSGLSNDEYRKIAEYLNLILETACVAVEAHGLERSAHVVCP